MIPNLPVNVFCQPLLPKRPWIAIVRQWSGLLEELTPLPDDVVAEVQSQEVVQNSMKHIHSE